jgi:hypothetical protein
MLANRLDQLERSFEERVQQVEQHSEALIVEQGQWIEAGVQEPLRGLQELWDRVAMLMRRMSNIEEYLGLQGGAQPIVLFNGQDSERVTRFNRDSVRGETVEPTPDPEDNDDADAGVTEDMESIKEIEVVQEGEKRQDFEHQAAVPPLVNTKADADADGEAEDMEGVEPKEEVNQEIVKENDEEGWRTQQLEAESAVLEEDPEHADAENKVGAVPGIQIIPATPQDSQEMALLPMTVAPPLPPLVTPTSVAEATTATPATATAVPAATPASAVTIFASPHPSPPRTELRRSPRLLSPGPSVIPSTTPLPQPRLSTSPRPSPSPPQLR